jgi:hypothetical protein
MVAEKHKDLGVWVEPLTVVADTVSGELPVQGSFVITLHHSDAAYRAPQVRHPSMNDNNNSNVLLPRRM